MLLLGTLPDVPLSRSELHSGFLTSIGLMSWQLRNIESPVYLGGWRLGSRKSQDL